MLLRKARDNPKRWAALYYLSEKQSYSRHTRHPGNTHPIGEKRGELKTAPWGPQLVGRHENKNALLILM